MAKYFAVSWNIEDLCVGFSCIGRKCFRILRAEQYLHVGFANRSPSHYLSGRHVTCCGNWIPPYFIVERNDQFHNLGDGNDTTSFFR